MADGYLAVFGTLAGLVIGQGMSYFGKYLEARTNRSSETRQKLEDLHFKVSELNQAAMDSVMNAMHELATLKEGETLTHYVAEPARAITGKVAEIDSLTHLRAPDLLEAEWAAALTELGKLHSLTLEFLAKNIPAKPMCDQLEKTHATCRSFQDKLKEMINAISA